MKDSHALAFREPLLLRKLCSYLLNFAGWFDQMLRELEIMRKETELTKVITKTDFYE
jgi:hypothetical protein